MNKFAFWVAAACAVAATPLMAQGQAPTTIPTRVTAKALTAVCGEDRSACLTYVLGVVDTFTTTLTLAQRPQAYCIPRGTSNDQVAATAVKHLRAHPQEANTNAAIVVIAGLKEAYPCGY